MKHWLNLHLIISLFFLPLLVAYSITGAMYMAGAPGDLGNRVEHVQLHLPNALSTPEDATEALKAAGVELPMGEWRKARNGNLMLGSSAGRHLQLTADGSLSIVTPGLYPQMLLIHKGKAGSLWFTILGYGAAASMLILYVSGLAIVWRNKKKRPVMLTTLVAGIVAIVAGLLAL